MKFRVISGIDILGLLSIRSQCVNLEMVDLRTSSEGSNSITSGLMFHQRVIPLGLSTRFHRW